MREDRHLMSNSSVLPFYLRITFRNLMPSKTYQMRIPQGFIIDKGDIGNQKYEAKPNEMEEYRLNFTTVPHERCENGLDDDENGLTDCDDPACAGTSVNCLGQCPVADFAPRAKLCSFANCAVTRFDAGLRTQAVWTIRNISEIEGSNIMFFDVTNPTISNFLDSPESLAPYNAGI